jgi:hypothetical protein
MIEFATPLDWVEFHVNGKKHLINNVKARQFDEDGVLVQTVEGGYWHFPKWEAFTQSPGANFFDA